MAMTSRPDRPGRRVEDKGLEPLAPCVQGRRSEPTELIPGRVVPGRVELPTSTLSVWRSDLLSYGTGPSASRGAGGDKSPPPDGGRNNVEEATAQGRTGGATPARRVQCAPLQKGGVPAAPSGTATLLRLSPSHRFCPRAPLAAAHFRHPRLPWLDGRCVQGPGTYSPRHG